MLNPLKINDWKYREFLVVAFSSYFALIGAIGLDTLNISIPILRQLLALIFLLFIPGFIILRILKIHNLSTILNISLAVGLSISYIIFLGLFVNLFFPLIGITRPISLYPIIISITVSIFSMMYIAYIRDKNFSKNCKINLKQYFNPIYIVCFLLPILSIFGCYILTYYHNNVILILLIIVSSVIPVIALLRNNLNYNDLFALILLTVGLSLLFHNTLISLYPPRINVDWEYYFQNLVIKNGYWNYNLAPRDNSCLSIVILSPIISIVANMHSFWTFKVVYQFIFSIVPMILYEIYKKQFGSKVAFLSALYFIYFFYFYSENPLLRRQEIAIFYCALLFYLLLNHSINKLILIILSISLIVSHYSTATLFFIILVMSYFINRVIIVVTKDGISSNQNKKIDLKFIFTYLIILFVWYYYTSQGDFINAVLTLCTTIFLEYIGPKSPLIKSGLGGDFFSVTLLGKIFRVFQYASQFFTLLGFLILLFRKYKNNAEYVPWATSGFIFLLFTIVAPYMSVAMNLPRIYFILLLFISPLCIIGARDFCSFIFNNLNIKINQKVIHLLVLLLLLVPLFLFYSGLIFELSGYSYLENREKIRIPVSDRISLGRVDSVYYKDSEYWAAKWIEKNIEKNKIIYVDEDIGRDLISAFHTNIKTFKLHIKLQSNTYIFLRSWNIYHKELIVSIGGHKQHISLYDLPELKQYIDSSDIIYFNGGAKVIWIL